MELMTTQTTTIADDARALRVLGEQYAEAKAKSDELKAQVAQAERELFERMEEEGVDGLKADGVNFVPTGTTYAQVQDRAAFIEWAEVHQPELIEQKERKQLINQLVRERIDNGEPLPPGMGFYVKEYISERAA